MTDDMFHYGVVGVAMAALLGIAALSSGCTAQQAATANTVLDDACAVASSVPLSPQDQALVGVGCVGGKMAVAVASDPATQQALLALKARLQAK